MIDDAKIHEEEDRKAKQLVDSVNFAESIIYQLEKDLKEHESRIPAAEAESLRNQIKELRDILASKDSEQIKSKAEEIRTASFKVFENVYKSQSSNTNQDNQSQQNQDNQTQQNQENEKKQ